MTGFDSKLWNKQYEQLVEFEGKNGHCLVPQKYQEDASLGKWVNKQRRINVNNKLRVDRKGLLDEIGFAWNVKQTWHQQYEKLVAFKQKNGNCLVPRNYKEDASLGTWVSTQRMTHTNNILLPGRKKLLDEIDFVWKADTLAAACSSTTHVSGLVIASNVTLYSGYFSSHSRSCCSAFNFLCDSGFGLSSVHRKCVSSKRNTRRNGVRTRPRR
jgi:hypothetical protein